jgi:hypothetical protein
MRVQAPYSASGAFFLEIAGRVAVSDRKALQSDHLWLIYTIESPRHPSRIDDSGGGPLLAVYPDSRFQSNVMLRIGSGGNEDFIASLR